ncbi:LOW QUALITY PROTEIN: uncharacterized protein LOC110978223 [Acanthaster planci]|uniref:LOW QUALITY PROTEIN: uncharacterized protein LOC110978223 n=1 Tax=Acanthaster planci TaxID=133434 RepID=A0A8B7Y697_ACAPL|nr:LOW QUALITY PROTEIN: uncharacterized protein LOC110978223 [Acanthaster planci]
MASPSAWILFTLGVFALCSLAVALDTVTVWCPQSTEGETNSKRASSTTTVLNPTRPVALDNNNMAVPAENITCNITSAGGVTMEFNYEMPDPIEYGLNTVTCTATHPDNSTVTDSCTFTINIVDNESPTFSTACPTEISTATDNGSSTANVTWPAVVARDNVGVVSLTSTHSPPFEFPVGNTTVEYIALDADGNNVTCSFIVSVSDMESPVVVLCPNDTITGTDPGVDYANVTWTEPVFSDNVNYTTTASHMRGDRFEIGNTTVVYNATDEAGNSVQCSFVITVEDREPPTFSNCQPQILAPTEGNNTFGFVTWDLQIQDNVGVSSIVNSSEPGSMFMFGNNTVNVTAVDVYGNEATCNFTVTVYDASPPMIINCPQSIMNETSEALLSISWIPPNATDNIDPTNAISVSSTYSPGDNFTVAQVTVVVYTFTDTSNNSDTCSFKVTVIDVGNPVFITCPTTLEYVLAGGQSSQLVSISEPLVQDNSMEMITPVLNGVSNPTTLSYGEYEVNYTAADAAGNMAAPCVFTISIKDEEAPELMNCPSSVMSLLTDPGLNTTNFNWTEPTATDNVRVVSLNASETNPVLLPIGNNTITIVAMDPAGNSDMCEFYVLVQDLEPPTVDVCPSDIVVGTDPGVATANVTFSPEFSDNDEVATIVGTNSSGSPFPVGNSTVVFVATDRSGNEANCTFFVIVQDDEAPVISNCLNITNSTDPGQNYKNITWPQLTYTDNVAIVNVTASHSQGDSFTVGDTPVTITVSDEAQNVTECTFVVTIVDEEPPSLSPCPAVIFNSTEERKNSSVVFWQEPVITDNVGVVSNMSSHRPGDPFLVGNTTVNYTASDDAGNMNSCAFVVVITDNESPELQCPTFIFNSTDANQNSSVVFWQEPVFTDNVGVVSNESTHSPGDVFPLGNSTVTYTVSDEAGNTANCSFIVSVEDDEAPMFSSCPSGVVNTTAFRQNSSVVFWPEPMFSDNVGVVSNSSNYSPGDVFDFGNTTVTYTVTDGAGNSNKCSFIVTVLDDEQPTVSGCPNSSVVPTDPSQDMAVVTWQEPVFADNVGVASNTSTHRPGDEFGVMETVVNYTASDSSGNTYTCSFTITVYDDEPPMFPRCMDVTISTDPGQNVSSQVWNFPEATDNVGITMNQSSHQPGQVFPLGMTPVMYTVFDAAGLNATCSFDVVVEDNEMPNITYCPIDVTLNTTGQRPVAVYVLPEAECGDNAGPVTITYSTFDNEFPIDATEVTIACFDEASNSDICTVTVTVLDLLPPRLLMCPDDMYAFADRGTNVTVNWTQPVAEDNSGSATVSSNYNTGDEFMNGTYIVEYTATDRSGNMDSCNFTLTVYATDSESPMVVICPNDTTVPADPDSNSTVVTWPVPVITDNVGVTMLDLTHPNESVFFIGPAVTVGYTASDLAGNTASCNFTVTVVDTQPPMLVNCSDDLVEFTSPGSNGIYLTIDLPAIVENDMYRVEQHPYPGHLFTVGNTTVQFIVRDRSGLNDSCEFKVLVIDNQPPSLSPCPSDMEIPTDARLATANVTWTVPSATDNVGVVSFTNSSEPGVVVDLGDTLEVIYMAYDEEGFNATCQFTITVVDEEDPDIQNCTGDVYVNTTAGEATGIANWEEPTATDNSGTVTLTASIRPGAVLGIGSTPNTYIALDGSGNTQLCKFQIIVQDFERPNLTMCPDDIYMFTYPGTNISISWTPPMVKDNSGDVTVSSNYNPGEEFANGTYTVTYTATDGSGNVGSCSFVIQINSTDTEPPMIQCPDDIVLPADNGSDSTVVTWPPPPYMDNNRVILVNVTRENGSLFYLGTEVVTYTVYDVLFNNDTCSFNVTILDTQDPMIVNCPNGANGTTDVGLPQGTVSWNEPVISDNSGSVNVDLSHQVGSKFPVGTIEVTYLVTDNSSNSAICSFNVTVTDDESPVFDCPMDFTNGTLPGRDVGTFSVAPAVTDNVNVSYSNFTHRPGDELVIGKTDIVYYARDAAGNEAICQFTVTIEDDEKPQILNCTAEVYANASLGTKMAYVVWPQPTAIDNTGIVTLTDDIPSNSLFSIGVNTVTYGAIDGAGNVETCTTAVNVLDVEDPTVVCPRNIEVFADNGTTIRLNWSMPIANDNSGIFTVNSNRPLNSEFAVGTHYITITVTDRAGNTANCTFSVIVYPTDTEVPIIICPQNVIRTTDPRVNYTNVTWEAPEYRDNQEVTVIEVDYQNGSQFFLGTTEVTYFIADRMGNNASCSFNVTVLDDEDPFFVSCPSDVVLLASQSRVYLWSPPNVTDNSGRPINVTSNYPLGTEFPYGGSIVVFTAEDESGNTASCNFTIFAEDSEPPTLLNCSSNIELYLYNGSTNATATWNETVFSDNSGNFTVTQEYFPGYAFPFGNTEVVINATDAAGNSASCVFNVTVFDLSPPVILNCPNNFSIVENVSLPNITWPAVQAVDNVEVASLIPTRDPSTLFPVGVTEVTYIAADTSGNTNVESCTFYVEVIDNVPPVFVTCPSDITVSNDPGRPGASVNWTVPIVMDNADVTVFESTHQPNANFSLGMTDVTYRISDAAGNNNTCTFTITVIDDEDPVFQNCPVNITTETDPGSNMAVVTWDPLVVTDNSGATITPTSASRSGDSFGIGSSPVMFVAIDPDSNIGRCNFEVIVVDKEPPMFSICPSDQEGIVIGDGNMTFVNWTDPVAEDNSGSVNVTALTRTQGEFVIGTAPVIYIATDPYGNTASCSFNVTVFALNTLMIACPPDVRVPADLDSNSTLVSWPLPMYNASITADLTSTRPINSSFEVGRAVVVYTVRGINGDNASCDFFVTVTDDQSPVFTSCPSNVVGSTSPALATGTMFWVVPVATDNVGVKNLTFNFEPTDLFPIGPTLVTYTAIDAAGNTESCSFNATVVDGEDPSFTFCPTNIEFTTNANGAIVVPTWGMPNATDNAGPPMLTSDYNLTRLAVGSTTLITFTAVDEAGNEATCMFNITVIDGTPPAIFSCPMDMVISTDPGLATALANWTEPTATDNYQLVSFEPDVQPLTNLTLGPTKVTYTAVDSVGLTAQCEFNVTVEDQEQPTISICPVNAVGTSSPGANNGSVFWIAPTANDNVGVVSFDSNYQPNDVLPVGSRKVVYTAVDAAGNVARCEFDAIVADVEDPVFTFCPADLEITTGANGSYVIPMWDMPNVTDNAGPPTVTNDYNGQPLMVGTVTTITYTAVDAFNNMDICMFDITVVDGTAPTIMNCPDDVTVPNTPNLATGQANWTAPVADDNVRVVNFTSDFNSGDVFDIGTTEVTYTATDSLGLTAVCQFNVTVEDVEPPVLTNCPNTLGGSTSLGKPNATVFWPSPSASDNSMRSVALDSNYQPNDEFPIGVSIVIYTATDQSGNSDNCSFEVTVVDIEIPVFTFCPDDITLNLEILETCLSSHLGTFLLPRTTLAPLMSPLTTRVGRLVNTTTLVTYTAVDSSGNPATCSFSVTIVDAVAPKIAGCPPSFVVNTTQNMATGVADWTEPSASDDQEVVSFVASHTPPLTLPVGDIVVNYTATDNQGFVTVCEFTIIVQDAEAPQITGCPLTTVATLAMGASVANPFWIAPTASDNVGLVSFESTAEPRDPMPAGRTEVTYTATDAAGNTETCTFTVVVLDNEAPVFTFCPASLDFATSTNGSFAVPSWPAPNATDNTGNTTITSDYNGQPLALGTTTLITYTVEDRSLNSDTCIFNVTIIDGTPPSISNCPDSFTVSTDPSQSSGQANWTEPTADDNEELVSFLADGNSGDFFPLGATLVTYVATDRAGFTATCSFNVTVGDNIQPQITGCPENVALNATEDVVVDWTPPTASDNVGVVNSSSSHVPNDTFALGSQTTVRYQFEDAAGNVATCSFLVTIYNATIGDDLPPMFVSCPSDQVVPTEAGLYNASVTWTVPMATDRESTPTVTGIRNPGDVFPVGNISVSYTATDSLGQTDTCIFFVTVRDEESPELMNCPPDINMLLPPSQSAVAATWNPPTAKDNSGEANVSANFQSGSTFGVGQTPVIFTAVDGAGNTDTCNFTVNVTGDAPPVFTTCPSNIEVNTTAQLAYATVSWMVPEAVDDDSSPIVIEANGYVPGSQFTMGTWTVRYIATDSSQQTATCEFNITVTDREAPVIEGCPSDITEVTLNNAPFTVTWVPPVATDNSGEYSIMTNDNHAPGEMLNVGTYDVIYTVTDPSGNSQTCEFTITIENDAPPVFTACPPSTTVSTDPGQSYATVSFSFPSPSDDRSNPSLVGSHAPGSQFGIGSTTVTYTAYDSAGQSTDCVFVITVEDRGDPVIMNCPSGQTVYILSTSNTAAVYWTLPTANDTSNVTLTSNKDPGDAFSSGSTLVRYTATDSAGNADTCSFSVVVLETLPTYETDGRVELVSIGSMPRPFSESDIQTRLPALRDDMDRLFRQSPVSSEFVGIMLTGSSVGGSNQAIVEFDIFFTGTPPPNDTEIASAFYSGLRPVQNEFDSGNEISPGTFMLSLSSCQNIPCDNGGSCVPDGNTFICMCTQFWKGDYCETDVNECVENDPCPADRVCLNLQGSYLCGCAPGFTLVGDSCISASEFRGSFAITRIGSSDAVFTLDLEDPTSAQYQRIAGNVTRVLDSIFEEESSFITSRVLGMSSGSIEIRYVLTFAEDTDMNEAMVTSQMSSSISADGQIGDSVLYIRPSSLTVASQICPPGFCKNDGTCSPDPVTYESTCTCKSPFSGERCEITDVWSPLVIAMVAVAAVLLLVLVGLFISCCCFLRKRLDEEPKYPGIHGAEQHKSFVKLSRPAPQRQPSAVEPPRIPRGRFVSTSFAEHTSHVDPGNGSYRQDDDSSDLGVTSYENQAFSIPYLQDEVQSARNQGLARQLQQIAMDCRSLDGRPPDLATLANDTPLPDYDENDEVFPVHDPFPHMDHTRDHLQVQRVGYANDVAPDYPQASTFIRPYIATGQEAMEHYYNSQQRRLEDDYF